MRITTLFFAALPVAALTAVAFSAPDALGQATTASPARYDMDVGTTSGFGGFGGGHINPLAMMTGRGNNGPQHEVFLRLGSSQTIAAPQADHFMPDGARLGRSVPLVTPQQTPAGESDRVPGPQGERPQGRILIFWGCGAHAPAGQPIVIDLSRLTAGQVPTGLFSTSIPRDRSVTFANSRTYGDWPNARSRAQLSSQSSILGAHRIAGNYSPEISFTLAQDFMDGLTATGAAQGDDTTQLSWNAVGNATGYYAWTMGMKSNGRGSGGDMVWWSSSASQQFGGGLWDWLSPATVTRLIQQRVVMPASQTSCTVPAEVKRAAPDFMFGNLYAYGPESNFAYPPRPANARTPWHPIWTARVRYRSNTSWMIGGPGMAAAGQAENQQTNPANCRRRGGLAGALGRAVGAPGSGC